MPPKPKPPKRAKPNKTKIKQWLKDHNHPQTNIDRDFDAPNFAGLLTCHGVPAETYRQAIT
jgi:hypothetical protein